MTHPYSRKELRSIIYGTLLGDSYITKSMFGCEQITLELINYKRKILESLINRDINISTRYREKTIIEGRVVNASRTYSVRVNHPHMKKYRRVFYTENRKRITKSILRRLSNEALAVWFMDDGYLDYKKSSNTRNLRICTDRYSVHDISLIIEWFKETHNIDCFIYKHKRNRSSKEVYRLSFNGVNSQRLVSLMYKYILPCFYYKIDLKYIRMNSINILPEYREAIKFISKNRAGLIPEDIV